MELGVVTISLGGQSRQQALAEPGDLGVDRVELSVGGVPGENHWKDVLSRVMFETTPGEACWAA